MRLRLRDLLATVLVIAIVVPYAGYLFTGRLPSSIGDFGGMAFVGLLLGIPAFLVQTKGDRLDRTAKIEEALAAAAIVIGIVAVVFSETPVAGLLLAVFMGSLLVVWAVELADHAGAVHLHGRATTSGG